VIKQGLKLAGPIIRGLKGIGKKVKAKVAAGKAWVKGKVDAGKKWVKGKAEAVRDFFSVKEKFTVDGESHELYTSGKSTALTVASGNPTGLANHQDKGVRDAYDAYEAAIAAETSPSAKKRVARAPLRNIIRVLKRWMRTSKNKDPQASAPGIGNMAPYGDLGSSVRSTHYRGAPEVWAMEKEHILPFAVGKRLWEIVGLVAPGRGGHEDDKQTTILIYKGAANEKTQGDKPLWESFAARVSADGVAKSLDIARTYIEDMRQGYGGSAGDNDVMGLAASSVRNVFHNITDRVGEAKRDAVTRTVTAVANENRVNGARRGPPGSPEAVIPTKAQIEQAASSQVADVMRILTGVVGDTNEGRTPNITPKKKRKKS
jgi:hypothetical protein